MPIWLIQLVVGVILSVASTLYQQSQQQKAQERRPGFRGTVQTGGKTPRSFLVGTIAVPGKQVYWNSWGESGGTPNAYAVDVLSFGDLPITAFTGLWVNTASETVSGSGHVDQGYPVTGDKAGYLWAEFFDGTQTTVNTYLNGKFGSDADRPWSSDMIGRGIPYLTLTALISDTVWTGFPTYMAQFQGIKLYDPRQDSSAGGSGSQRWDTPSTWAFSDNNMVIIYNILRGIHYAGDWVWGGRARAAQLPYAAWAAAMDACDENVTTNIYNSAGEITGTTTEKRFRAGREIFFNERPADVIGELLTGCTGRLTQSAGAWYPLVGVPDSADGSFTDDDLIITEGMTFEPFPNLDQIINGMTGTYVEPAQAWEPKGIDYIRSDLKAEDDDREQLQGLDLGTTFSGTQAQRILKATVEESRRFKRHVLQLRPSFGQYRPLQVLAWTSTSQSYTAKLFLITAKTELPNGNIIVGLQEIDPADYDWTAATDEKAISFAPLTPIRPAPIPMTGWDAEPYIFTDAASNNRRPGILVSYTGGLPDVVAVRIQVRKDFDDNAVVWDSGEQPYDIADADPVSRSITWAGIIPNADYEVRGKFISPTTSGRSNDWSSWIAVTAPDVKLGTLDVDFDAISADIAADISTSLAWARRAITNFERLGTLVAEQDIANFNDRRSLVRRLDAVQGNLSASILEVLEVALGPGGASATRLDALTAALGGDTAEIYVRYGAEAAPSGVTARWGLQLSTDGTTFGSAAIIAQVRDGDSEIILDAGRTVVSSDGGDTISALFTDGTTYLASALIQDATITGAKLVNATIGAAQIADAAITTAKIGAAAITAAKIGDLEVSTIKIADAAVNTVYSAGTLTSGSINWSSPYTATFNAAVSNTPVVVAALADLVVPGSGSSNVIYTITLTGNGVTLATATGSGLSSGARLTVPLSAVSVPGPSGTYTYTLTVSLSNFSGTATTTAYYCGIVGTVAKK